MAYFGPTWWHHYGSKMKIDGFQPKQGRLTIANNAATLLICNVEINTQGERWCLTWNIQCSIGSGKANGTILFKDEEMAVAFGLKPPFTQAHSAHLIKRYGGDRADQGKFIGFGEYLNIPMPGTGYDGDPNISIELDDKIKDAVKQLLDRE